MDPNFLAVEATAKRYRALVHEPSGAPIDADTGLGIWPADAFTYRRRDEGAIRIVEAEAETPKAKAASKPAGRAPATKPTATPAPQPPTDGGAPASSGMAAEKEA